MGMNQKKYVQEHGDLTFSALRVSDGERKNHVNTSKRGKYVCSSPDHSLAVCIWFWIPVATNRRFVMSQIYEGRPTSLVPERTR